MLINQPKCKVVNAYDLVNTPTLSAHVGRTHLYVYDHVIDSCQCHSGAI